jgi:hypothetical protein
VFEAIARHDPDSTVVIHSNSGRRFRYGELLGDVCKVRNRLYETAGRDDMDGERIAFLVENSYDYVGKLMTARSPPSQLGLTLCSQSHPAGYPRGQVHCGAPVTVLPRPRTAVHPEP